MAEEPNIAMDFMLGGTHIKIATNYCVTEKEEIDKILQRIAEKALEHFAATEWRKQQDNMAM